MSTAGRCAKSADIFILTSAVCADNFRRCWPFRSYLKAKGKLQRENLMVPEQSMKVFARAALVTLALVTFVVSAYGNNPPPVITEGSMNAGLTVLKLSGTDLIGELGYGVYSVTMGGTVHFFRSIQTASDWLHGPFRESGA